MDDENFEKKHNFIILFDKILSLTILLYNISRVFNLCRHMTILNYHRKDSMVISEDEQYKKTSHSSHRLHRRKMK
jgi:hypothetical protein